MYKKRDMLSSDRLQADNDKEFYKLILSDSKNHMYRFYLSDDLATCHVYLYSDG